MKLPKHHYIPVFYLKQWRNRDGNVIEFSRPYGNIVKPLRKSPDATGYVRGLYRLPGVDDRLAEAIEERFMKPIDSLAADALHHMLANKLQDWPMNRRTAWSRFLIGLLLRNPQMIGHVTAGVQKSLTENREMWQRQYEAVMSPDAPPFSSLDVSHPLKMSLITLQKLIDHEQLMTFINGMIWGNVEVEKTKYRFLTSDRPVVLSNGIGKDDGYLLAPLSPIRIFVACNNESVVKHFRSLPPRVLVMAVNKHVVRRALKYVWAQDESQSRLITGQMSAEAALDQNFVETVYLPGTT